MSTPLLADILSAAFVIIGAVDIVAGRRGRGDWSPHYGPLCPCHSCQVMTDLMRRDIDQVLTGIGAGQAPAPAGGRDGAA